MRATVGTSKRLAGADLEELKQVLVMFVEQMTFILNGNVDLIDNLKLELIKVDFAFGTDSDVRHSLGRVPRGYIVVSKSGDFNIYDGATIWSTDAIYIASSASGSATLIIF